MGVGDDAVLVGMGCTNAADKELDSGKVGHSGINYVIMHAKQKAPLS